MQLLRPVAAAVVASAVATGCGGAAGPATVVDVSTVGSLGPVLTTSTGRTLYMFPPDSERRVSCVGTCALSWPPLTVSNGGRPTAGRGVQSSLLGTDADPAGGPRVVTYDGWPLYTYRDDTRPGQATGQGVDVDGGYWYVMSPSGQPVTVPES